MKMLGPLLLCPKGCAPDIYFVEIYAGYSGLSNVIYILYTT